MDIAVNGDVYLLRFHVLLSKCLGVFSLVLNGGNRWCGEIAEALEGDKRKIGHALNGWLSLHWLHGGPPKYKVIVQ